MKLKGACRRYRKVVWKKNCWGAVVYLSCHLILHILSVVGTSCMRVPRQIIAVRKILSLVFESRKYFHF
jgi:hypothetical protein